MVAYTFWQNGGCVFANYDKTMAIRLNNHTAPDNVDQVGLEHNPRSNVEGGE